MLSWLRRRLRRLFYAARLADELRQAEDDRAWEVATIHDWPDDEESVDPTVCVKCKIHRATTTWIGDGGVLAIVHGGGVPYCRCCAVREQLEHARERAARIYELERELITVRCELVVDPPPLERQCPRCKKTLRHYPPLCPLFPDEPPMGACKWSYCPCGVHTCYDREAMEEGE